ncbi:MAG: hypothetical protein IPK33_06525 [Gemmatimonadetes bacterium]|nr:hypothetical protein [Gemmatimonadota bacterium]
MPRPCLSPAPVVRRANHALHIAAAALLLFPAVARIGRAQAPPHPREALGHEVGADRQLADWGQIGAYFTRLAASPAVRVDTLGLTTAGLPLPRGCHLAP